MMHGNPYVVTETAAALSRQIAESIRARLCAEGMNQSELARRMGVHRAWVSRMMRGYTACSLREIGSAAEILHLQISVRVTTRGRPRKGKKE